ncbi:MAG: molybdenum cofactor biosynthesis protein B [Perlucidibaca sp.]
MSHAGEKPFVPLQVAVLTVSDTRDLASDTSGQYLVDQLAAAGHVLADRAIVVDDIYQIRARVSAWIAAADVHSVIITGGTGFSGRDSTPEAVLPLLDKTIDGFGELFRHISYGEIGTSTLQSRALAGLANRTAVFCLPGSTSACRTAWEGILAAQLDNRTRPCNLVPHLKPTQPACETRG